MHNALEEKCLKGAFRIKYLCRRCVWKRRVFLLSPICQIVLWRQSRLLHSSNCPLVGTFWTPWGVSTQRYNTYLKASVEEDYRVSDLKTIPRLDNKLSIFSAGRIDNNNSYCFRNPMLHSRNNELRMIDWRPELLLRKSTYSSMFTSYETMLYLMTTRQWPFKP